MSNRNDWLPADRIYDGESYLWVKPEFESDQLHVGIGSPTIESLGELAYLTLAEPGTQVTRGQSVGSMEAAKMTGDIVSPVSGTIVDRNESALENPRMVSTDPYGEGWLLKIEPFSWETESGSLHDSESLFALLPSELRGQHNDA